MHIAVCDDSAFDRELIVELLHIYFAQKPFQYKLAQYNSGINLVCDVEDHFHQGSGHAQVLR